MAISNMQDSTDGVVDLGDNRGLHVGLNQIRAMLITSG